MIDLRSDTVTRPTAAMRRAMAEAPVGDDVIDIDPSIQALEERTAELLGKEAAIFMPSGSMTNQIAVRVHCQPGDEFLCEADCHIYNYEQAAFAQLSGLVARTVQGEYGVLRLDQLEGLIRPAGDHQVQTRLVCLENTHNRGGGRVWPYDALAAICEWARQSGLATHLDGARLFNAVVASGVSLDRWAAQFDSVSVCFSKGLGAPVGSALAGTAEFVKRARRARKLFGGGMRQAGIIAAGALYALEHHRDRLAEDHLAAQRLAAVAAEVGGVWLEPERVDSNIVMLRIAPQLGSAAEMVAWLAEHGVQVLPFGPQYLRLVTHLDVNARQIDRACQVLSDCFDHFSHRSCRPATC